MARSRLSSRSFGDWPEEVASRIDLFRPAIVLVRLLICVTSSETWLAASEGTSGGCLDASRRERVSSLAALRTESRAAESAGAVDSASNEAQKASSLVVTPSETVP